jgi:hypothetical protein
MRGLANTSTRQIKVKAAIFNDPSLKPAEINVAIV